jgi:hypothetical protein
LDPAHGVEVRIVVDHTAEQLAREGSRFWIERPRVSLSRVGGLETVVGAKYVGVLPGPSEAKRAKEFEGLSNPPTLAEPGGDEIAISFRDGHGIAVGDVLKHRGIDVGEVTAVELSEDLDGVVVLARLVGTGTKLARAGTHFWIERPAVSLQGVRGLETLVSGRHLAASPGPSDAPPQYRFTGLEAPPAIEEQTAGGLEIILSSPQRSGLERGAPVAYRGLPIGRIVSVGLTSDASAVEARAWIEPRYRNLIRENSQFWSTSGVDLRISPLTGLEFSADTLETIAAGGVAVATPSPAGEAVATGKRFSLIDKAPEEWQSWQTQLAIGEGLLPEGKFLPEPLRATLQWKKKVLGFTRSEEGQGWVLPLDDGRLLGPASLLTSPADAIGPATLEAAGHTWEAPAASAEPPKRVMIIDAPAEVLENATPWPRKQIRQAKEPEDCVIVADVQTPLPVSTAALTQIESGWEVASSIPLTAGWNGACVVSRRDGALIGIVMIAKGQAIVAPIVATGLK